MNSRLKKRGILALVIYFLMITAVSTPIAFFTGKARGAPRIEDTAVGAQGLSQSDTDASKSDMPIAVAMTPEGQPPTAATEPSSANSNTTPRARLTPRAPSQKPAALRDAVLRALTTEPASPTGDGTGDNPQAPINLAMAPNSTSGGLTQGGTPNAPAGFPGAIVPGFTPLSTGSNTPGDNDSSGGGPVGDTGGPDTPMIEDPSVVVTPIPAALPLMLTGFAGLFALGRKTRKS